MRQDRTKDVSAAADRRLSGAMDWAARASVNVSEPPMAAIPEGWFLMGSETGQDNERPVHRVWVDAFEMAECQVTNAEYGQFSVATKHRAPRHGQDANFSDAEQPV